MTSNYLQKRKNNCKLIHAVRIYSQGIGMEFGIEKFAMLLMKSGKRHLTDVMYYQNKTHLERSQKTKPTNY